MTRELDFSLHHADLKRMEASKDHQKEKNHTNGTCSNYFINSSTRLEVTIDQGSIGSCLGLLPAFWKQTRKYKENKKNNISRFENEQLESVLTKRKMKQFLSILNDSYQRNNLLFLPVLDVRDHYKI